MQNPFLHPTLREIAEQRRIEDEALAKLGLSGKSADITWDLRKLAVIVAALRHKARRK